MKKAFYLAFILVYIITSCSPIVTQNPPTDTPQQTVTPALTPTPTLEPTPEYVCRDQELGDLSDPGIPETSERLDKLPGKNFLQYDDVNFDVFQQDMHNRTVTVAIHKNMEKFTTDRRKDISEFIFKTWAIYWKEFGGFPFQYYRLLIGENLPYDADLTGVGEFGPGYVMSQNINEYTYADEPLAHGIAHAWFGGAFGQYGGEMWLTEGLTVYYGVRQSGDYFGIMNGKYSRYVEILENGWDRPLATVTQNNNAAEKVHYIHYIKGLYVAYLIDVEMKKNGHHVGELVREIYMQYGSGKSQGEIKDREVLQILNRVSGRDFTDFFNKYIYGTEPLPIDIENIGWVCHDNKVEGEIKFQEPKNYTLDPPITIPVVVDGYDDEWKNLSNVKTLFDPPNFPNTLSITDGTQLVSLNVAEDENYLVIMVKTKGPIDKSFRFGFALDLAGDADFSKPIVLYKVFETSAEVDPCIELICDFYNRNLYECSGGCPYVFTKIKGIIFKWGNVLEILIPKDSVMIFNNDKPLKVNPIIAYVGNDKTAKLVDATARGEPPEGIYGVRFEPFPE